MRLLTEPGNKSHCAHFVGFSTLKIQNVRVNRTATCLWESLTFSAGKRQDSVGIKPPKPTIEIRLNLGGTNKQKRFYSVSVLPPDYLYCFRCSSCARPTASWSKSNPNPGPENTGILPDIGFKSGFSTMSSSNSCHII